MWIKISLVFKLLFKFLTFIFTRIKVNKLKLIWYHQRIILKTNTEVQDILRKAKNPKLKEGWN